MGFVVPPFLRLERWALTPPFHPYPSSLLRVKKGGLFSVTLSVTGARAHSPRNACARHAALWCPDFPPVRDFREETRRATAPGRPVGS